MKYEKKFFKCILKVLTPVHIGCDEIYEPMGFVVDEKEHNLIVFDPLDFIAQMKADDKKKYSEICSKGTIDSILEIYKFLRGKKAFGRRIKLCNGFIAHYNKTLNIDRRNIRQELNNFKIERTSFLSNDERPYIPGSSVKGSFRTAYLNGIKKQVIANNAKELEKKLLNYWGFEEDPFRLVKISDFMPVGQVNTKIVYAINKKKVPGKREASGPYQILEVIEPNSLFEGEITIEKPLGNIIKNPINLSNLLNSSIDFYSSEKKREDIEMRQIGIASFDALWNQNKTPVRIGRHSGAESLTIEGHRKIKVKIGQKEYKDMPKSTTFWFASEQSKSESIENLKPFGWIELEELTEEKVQDIKNKKQEYINTPQTIKTDKEKVIEKPPEPKKPVIETKNEIWEKASLTWKPNDQTITASFEGSKAISKSKDLVPEPFKKTLFDKKKGVTAKVTVEKIGNFLKIIKIEK